MPILPVVLVQLLILILSAFAILRIAPVLLKKDVLRQRDPVPVRISAEKAAHVSRGPPSNATHY